MSTNNFKFDHQKLAAALDSLTEAARSIDVAELHAEIAPLRDRYRAGIFPLVMMGEIKVGKSSIVNAMLSPLKLVPTDTDISTSTVYKIHYGPDITYRVHFIPQEDGTPGPPPLSIARSDLESYGTEGGNPGNVRRVEFIEVQCPHPLLESGVTLVDLPGLGGLVKNHALQVMRYLPNAAGVVYVVSSTDVASDLDITWIKRLRDRSAPPPIVFLQSKSDISGQAQAQQRRCRNLEMFSGATGLAPEKLSYFVVSSKVKEAAEARAEVETEDAGGFSAFREFVEGVLVRRKHDLLAIPLWKAAFDGVHERIRRLEEAHRVASSLTHEELDNLNKEALKNQEEYASWKRHDMEAVFTKFNDSFDEATREAEDLIAIRIDPWPHGQVIGTRIEFLRDAQLAPGDLVDCVEDERDALVAACDRALDQAIENFDNRVSKAYTAAATAVGDVLQGVNVNTHKDSSYQGSDLRPWVPNSQFEVTRNAVLGSGFASGIAYATIGAIFPPAAAIAAVAGALLGGFETFRVARNRQRKAVLESIRAMLSEVNRRLYDESTKTLRRYSSDVKRQMLRNMHKAVAQREDELKKRLHQITEQRRCTADDAQKKQLDLRRQITQLATVARQLNEARLQAPANKSAASLP